MSEHTPGPWVTFIDDSEPGCTKFHILPACRDGEIAADIRSSADAYLINAAPDLLECLRDLLTAAEAEVNEKGGGGFILARMTDARAAIAKAEGRWL